MRLQTCNLTVQIGAHVLLNDINLDFATDQLTIIIGPNGAGKTTLLKCLAGELIPTRGQVLIGERKLDKLRRAELARQRAVLSQHPTLDFPFSVLEVVLMGRMPHPTTDADNLSIAQRALELCGCDNIQQRIYTSLSGGEQQRVQFARVLAQVLELQPTQPRFLLLDEPITALDLQHQYNIMHLLRNLCLNEKIGVICTLHNLNLVAQFADRIIILNNGIKIADGAPPAVLTADIIMQVFNLGVTIRTHPDDKNIPLLIPNLGNN